MKAVLLAAIVAVGCGGDDPHEVVACNVGGGLIHECETACTGSAALYGSGGSDSCEASNPTAGTHQCDSVKTIDGARGCCFAAVVGDNETVVRLFECD